jgi:hypothetical protein
MLALPAAAQNPEMMERTCSNLTGMAQEEGWRDLTAEWAVYTGDYDDPDRQGSREWRLETICEGRFAWAIALFGDVAPFVLMPTQDPLVFVDFDGNEWIFALDEDGAVQSLTWRWPQRDGESFTLLPVAEGG